MPKPLSFLVILCCLQWVTAFAQPQYKGLENLMTMPKAYTATYTPQAPVIDGDINDPVWQNARWTDDFVDIEGDVKPRPQFKTNVKMLWDDSCLYVAARVIDPNVWATLKKHDQVVFADNDVELFINPNGTTHQYFEIECNAINTIFDLYLNKPYRNGGTPMAGWDVAGLRSAVKIQGTLNDPKDVDKGWTMEMAIPLRELSTGNRVQVPHEGTLWRINFSRVEWDTKVVDGHYEKLKGANGRYLPEHNWSWSPQGIVNMHFPERWGYLQFTKSTIADKPFVLPLAEEQKHYLWLIYYKEKKWHNEHHAYTSNLKDLGLDDKTNIDNTLNEIRLEATPHQFMGFISDDKDKITYTINNEGLTAILNKESNE